MTRVDKTVLIALFIYFFCLQLLTAWAYTADDSLISLLYAKNFAEGHGFVFNVGEAPLAGFSNFLWVVLLSVLYPLNVDATFLTKVLSFFFLITSLIWIYFISHKSLDSFKALLVVILFLSYPGVVFWSVSGMETMFFITLILASFYFCQQALFKQNSNALYLSFFILGLSQLTRPDAVLFLISQVVGLCLWKMMRQGLSLKVIIKAICIFLIIYLPFLTWHLAYFNELLPHPLYCKLGNTGNFFVLSLSYLKLSALMLLISIFYGYKEKDIVAIFYVLPSVLLLFALLGVDETNSHLNRYGLACFALLIIYTMRALGHLWPDSVCQKKAGIFCAFLFLLMIIPHESLTAIHASAKSYAARNQVRLEVAHYLNAHAHANDKVVIADCGFIPYFSNHLVFIDSLCLNNREFLSKKIHRSYEKFYSYVLNERYPEWVLLTKLSGQYKYDVNDFTQIVIRDKQNFLNKYQLKTSFLTKADNGFYQYELYQKKKENVVKQ